MLRSFLRTVIVYLSLSTSARAIIENARGHGRYLTAAGLFRGRMSSKEGAARLVFLFLDRID